jgi:hypothetical protein
MTTEKSMTTSIGTGSASTGELLSKVSEQISTLVHDEIRLAELQMTAKAKRGMLGGGMFAASAGIGYLGLASFVAAAIIGIAVGVPAWLAAILVGVALLAIAGIIALIGKSNIKQATPPVPTESIESVKADVQTVKEAIRR